MPATIAEKDMGRPKRAIPTTSTKIEVDADELVRKACTFLGEDKVSYCSRVLREQALKDLREGVARFQKEDEARKKKGDAR